MDLLHSILNAKGGAAVSQLAGQFGLGEDQAASAIQNLVPALAGGLQRNISQGGLENLLGALTKGQHQRDLDDPSTLNSEGAREDRIFAHILGSEDVSRQVAATASAPTGISDSILKQMLPTVAALAMGALSKQTEPQTVVPENSIGIEITELVGVGFSTMFAMLPSFVRSFRVYFQSRADLQTEILALRHQIVVLQRGTPKPKLKPADRRFWILLSRFWSRWHSALWILKPATVYRLAPSRFPLVLDMEGSTWTTRSAACVKRTARTDPDSEPRQCRMGSAQNP